MLTALAVKSHFSPVSPRDLETHHSPLADTASLAPVSSCHPGVWLRPGSPGLYGSNCGVRAFIMYSTTVTKKVALTLHLTVFLFLY